ncbi:HepT-like ribonuclease domain-containing protein [Collinsella tanakaei]|uniref:HepT-like ribonuclease domain-containing protein n=1 Tax=Collinsella tanakaei TaxID=626935 RepID=UPI0025A3279C|nr:HepT-like ribonuclease domain-containing protein [Collinsella tanakaei]MDM8300976.1 DUF86 domain-containing protein [Collinsella tanakaei]
MSARNSDDARVAEIYRVIRETNERVRELNLTKDVFVSDESAQGRMNADGIFMCVFRVAEEAGNMSSRAKEAYPDIPWKAIHGMRNIFAHDYGKLDRSIVWSAVSDDFPKLEAFCRRYAADHGLKL